MMDGNKEYSLNFWEEAKRDYKKLDGSQLVFVKKGLKRIKSQGLLCGEPLHGALEGYRKLKNRKMGLRIVFGQNPQTKQIEVIAIVAIGKRENLEIYNTAVNRINNRK